LGRMVHKKGFDVLIRAFKNHLDQGFKGTLSIGGDGVEKSNLDQLVQNLKVSDHVKFDGWVDDIANYLAKGDVFVLPSRDEPFGIVVLEAMASGKPIITTKTKGPVTILNKDSAYFTEIGDVETLTQAMQLLAENKALATQKAQAATALYQSTFCADAVVPKVEAIYKKLALK
jgi:glycosyltransferase involved in cell wall biosynthesis